MGYQSSLRRVRDKIAVDDVDVCTGIACLAKIAHVVFRCLRFSATNADGHDGQAITPAHNDRLMLTGQ
jgi:hypothetical protein